MSISKLQNLGLLGVIGSYANAQELGRMACTNKRLRDAAYQKVHRALLQAYAQEPALKSYVASVQLEKTPLTALFQRIIQDVKATDGGKELLACFEWPAVCLQSTPAILANWILQQKAKSLLVLFGKVAQEIPAAQAFLNTLAEAGTEIEQAAAIRTWLQANRALLNTITEMHLSFSSLTILPDEIAFFTQLQKLYLHYNQLQTLPTSLGNLTQLQVLTLYDNQLQTLPAELGNLTQLQELSLTNTQLQTLPAELGNLTQLQGLWLSYNQLQTLPAELGNLTQLQVLNLDNNPIQFVPKELKCSSIKAIHDNKVIQAAQEVPEETKPQPAPPSPWQQIADALYSCFSSIASFACWVWTRLMAALSEVR